jgi:hypothetical protein
MDWFAGLMTALGYKIQFWIEPISFIYALWIAFVIITRPLKERAD